MDWRDTVVSMIGWILIIGFVTMSLWTPLFSDSSESTSNSSSSASVVEDSYTSDQVDPPNLYEEYDNVPQDYDYDEPDYSNYDYNPEYNAYTDLDCVDIGYEHYVGSDDPNGLDGDGDGYACEGW